MSRVRLAREIAERTGSSFAGATRYVNNVGTTRARQSLRAVENSTTWRVPATVGAGTAGVVYWRQQNLRETESANDALRAIVESDLSAEDQAALVAGFNDENDDTERWNPLEQFGGDGIEATLLKIVLVIIIVGFVLNYAEGWIPQPPAARVSVGGAR